MSRKSPARTDVTRSLIKRCGYYLSRAGGHRLQKSQAVRFVTLQGHRFKRVILRDSHMAAQIERNLLTYGPSELLPAFVARYEHEVWVEYVAGDRLASADEATARDLATLYAVIHHRRTRTVALDDTLFHDRLRFDLRFLRNVAVVDAETTRALHELAERCKPARVRVGFDYTDPVLKNLVRRRHDGALCAVDVESLEDDQLVGVGAAKAFLRWAEPYRDAFFDAYRRASGTDLRDGFVYVELCFLAGYMKLMFLERKRRHLEAPAFDRLLGRCAGGGHAPTASADPGASPRDGSVGAR